jgi:hypothetical protein
VWSSRFIPLVFMGTRLRLGDEGLNSAGVPILRGVIWYAGTRMPGQPAKYMHNNGLYYLGLIDQAVVDGVKGQFQAVGDTKFIENIVQVILYGLLADEQLFADFLVAVALGD